VSLEAHRMSLARLRDKAELVGKFGPAIQAEIARGRVSGLYIEKVQHSSEDSWEVMLADMRRYSTPAAFLPGK
jgi:hypothetical protein